MVSKIGDGLEVGYWIVVVMVYHFGIARMAEVEVQLRLNYRAINFANNPAKVQIVTSNPVRDYDRRS